MVDAARERSTLATHSRRIRRHEASFSIQDGTLPAGMLPPRQTRLIQGWVELRRVELMEDWDLAVRGANARPVAPLR